MNKSKIKSLIYGCALASLTASINAYAEGSRYDLPRAYHSEISSAKAYLQMQKEEAVLIDVRRLREYAAGHPEKAFNVPFPHVVGSNDQDESVFYWAVYNIVNGKTDTAIMTLCRTGFRSVLAANILADPSSYGIDGPAFTNVRNIWEGFVGRYKEANADPGNFLDLNNNDVLDGDTSDVYSHTTDANPDKDGWRNYQELPWNTRLHVNRVYLNDRSLYNDYVE
jgi:rhodanese-related sulfurtransferase